MDQYMSTPTFSERREEGGNEETAPQGLPVLEGWIYKKVGIKPRT
jgi:hypothetical protein